MDYCNCSFLRSHSRSRPPLISLLQCEIFTRVLRFAPCRLEFERLKFLRSNPKSPFLSQSVAVGQDRARIYQRLSSHYPAPLLLLHALLVEAIAPPISRSATSRRAGRRKAEEKGRRANLKETELGREATRIREKTSPRSLDVATRFCWFITRFLIGPRTLLQEDT